MASEESAEFAALIADQFDLARPMTPMYRGAPSTLETWRLDTIAGSFLIKRLWRADAPAWLPGLVGINDRFEGLPGFVEELSQQATRLATYKP